jgi:hypothetical protein
MLIPWEIWRDNLRDGCGRPPRQHSASLRELRPTGSSRMPQSRWRDHYGSDCPRNLTRSTWISWT